MPSKHAEWVARAREVAVTLAADALERDRANAEPVTEASLLKDAGLPVSGHVYDIATGRVTTILDARRPQPSG